MKMNYLNFKAHIYLRIGTKFVVEEFFIWGFSCSRPLNRHKEQKGVLFNFRERKFYAEQSKPIKDGRSWGNWYLSLFSHSLCLCLSLSFSLSLPISLSLTYTHTLTHTHTYTHKHVKELQWHGRIKQQKGLN
jgi:hypothetical protein